MTPACRASGQSFKREGRVRHSSRLCLLLCVGAKNLKHSQRPCTSLRRA
jgi:hypothetical protein